MSRAKQINLRQANICGKVCVCLRYPPNSIIRHFPWVHNFTFRSERDHLPCINFHVFQQWGTSRNFGISSKKNFLLAPNFTRKVNISGAMTSKPQIERKITWDRWAWSSGSPKEQKTNFSMFRNHPLELGKMDVLIKVFPRARRDLLDKSQTHNWMWDEGWICSPALKTPT